MKIDHRMKYYESISSCNQRLFKNLPVIIRLDGKAFHTFTRNLIKPFDLGLIDLMRKTTEFLTKEFNAVLGYTQSDEISLLINNDNNESELLFDGKMFKINSILAATCSVYFNRQLPKYLPHKVSQDDTKKNPVFDCRCFNVPSKTEACNYFIWREQDAVRNSINSTARSLYSHNELMNKNNSELQELIFQRGTNWNHLPSILKRGSYFINCIDKVMFSRQELDNLPPNHAARTNPELQFERKTVKNIDLPILTTISNLGDVIFKNLAPNLKY